MLKPSKISNITKRIKNASLSQKFLIITLPGFLLLAVITALGFLLIVRSNNRLLYQTSAELLAYSSQDISQNLSAAESMADYILENETIQESLGKAKNRTDDTLPSNAYSQINSELDTYYERYKMHYINYIRLVNDRFFVQKPLPGSAQVIPKDIEAEMMKIAREGDGRLCWITDYADQYGVFLVRSVRRIDQLKLDEIGILVINIDMNRMIADLSQVHSDTNTVHYLLRSQTGMICASPELSQIRTLDFPNDYSLPYRITQVDHKRYFVVKGSLPDPSWEYFCLTPYDEIYRNIGFFQTLFLILLLVNVVFSLLLTRSLMRPLIQHFDNLILKIKAFGNEKFAIIKLPYSYEKRQDEIGLLHQQFDGMARRIQYLIKENYEHQLMVKDAQIKALEMQINPHFLYNTLESINWRARILGDTKISSMTSSLGKLLRITLSQSSEDSSLGQELELVRFYMNIQQIRYEEQLTFTMDVPEELLSAYLPKFTLQPLVENAIHYTLEEDVDACQVCLSASAQGEYTMITIANSDSSFEEDFLAKLMSGEITPNGFGIGILNVNKRLELCFENDYHLDFYNVEGYAVVQITIPSKEQV